jgi:hypothetical protein
VAALVLSVYGAHVPRGIATRVGAEEGSTSTKLGAEDKENYSHTQNTSLILPI